MAEFEKRNYSITIKADGLSGKVKPIAGMKSNSATETAKKAVTANNNNNKSIGVATVALQAVKTFAVQTFRHDISMVQLRTGSNELQERANYTVSVLQRGVGTLAMAGAALARGNIALAVTSVALSAIQRVNEITNNANRINTQRVIEAESIQRNMIRAGAYGSRRT